MDSFLKNVCNMDATLILYIQLMIVSMKWLHMYSGWGCADWCGETSTTSHWTATPSTCLSWQHHCTPAWCNQHQSSYPTTSTSHHSASKRRTSSEKKLARTKCRCYLLSKYLPLHYVLCIWITTFCGVLCPCHLRVSKGRPFWGLVDSTYNNFSLQNNLSTHFFTGQGVQSVWGCCSSSEYKYLCIGIECCWVFTGAIVLVLFIVSRVN